MTLREAALDLRSLAAKATKGPWNVGPGLWDELVAFYADSLWIGLATTGVGSDWVDANPIGIERARANAAYIVALVNAAPALLDERDRLREALVADAALLHHYVHPDIAFEECDGARCVRRRSLLEAQP